MKAELKDGSIVDLVKDCECGTHDGPHWIHMDQLDKQRAAEMFKRAENNAKRNHTAAALCGFQGYAIMEQERLQRKLYAMQSQGIIRLIREENDQ